MVVADGDLCRWIVWFGLRLVERSTDSCDFIEALTLQWGCVYKLGNRIPAYSDHAALFLPVKSPNSSGVDLHTVVLMGISLQ